MDRALSGLKQPHYANLLIDYSHAEDAGIYQINDDLALVQTLDFFPPIVDDPYTFGQISACNALSDIYAMGGIPKTAMSIVCFPDDKLDIKILRQIMDGALNKLIEAETALVGGHSISDSDVKFGLSVSGFVNPKKMFHNNKPRLGDMFILTKPLGSGIINTVLKAGFASKEAVNAATEQMIQLNKRASEIASNYDISCGTDITGFGLLGHLVEIIQHSELGIKVDYAKIELLPQVEEYAMMGLVPAGAYKNKMYRKCFIDDYEKLDQVKLDILFDPQTSGGLLLGVNPNEADDLLKELLAANIDAFICGEITDRAKRIEVVL
ncbi:MAG: selenide, water dikinase SelD [Candidatus Cloacimonetes bacterium 4572_65]|nr:MAG: selenide, water dikinase SelD [Candidatus Cloacimonetes bacterium 4572_65]